MSPRTLLVALFVATSVAAPASARASSPRPETCDLARTLDGTWSLTTRVTVAKSKGGAGVTGYYELTLEAVGCQLRATLIKSGYAQHNYRPREVLVGTAPIRVGWGREKRLDGAQLLRFPVTLESEAGGVVEMRFELLWTAKRIYGRWQYVGASWESAGMAGYVLGERRPGGGRVAFASERAFPCREACVLAGFASESERLECKARCTEGGLPSPVREDERARR